MNHKNESEKDLPPVGHDSIGLLKVVGRKLSIDRVLADLSLSPVARAHLFCILKAVLTEKDPLVEKINHYLQKVDQRTTVDELIVDAVGDYIFELMTAGRIVDRKLDEIESYLIEEARDYLKKKVYGFPSLYDYSRSLRINAN